MVGTLQLKGEWLLLAVLIGLAAVSLSLNTAAADQPVNITCNEDFQAQNFPGSGTPSDPYIIEGLTTTGADVAINIENTDVYVVIRNCNLTNNAYAFTPLQCLKHPS